MMMIICIIIYIYIYKGCIVSIFMKTNKVICLDTDIVDKLRKEINASGLINMLLIEHYNFFKSEKGIIDDVKAKIKAKKHENKVKKLIKAQLRRENE